MVADILARILDWKRQEVTWARQAMPLTELRQRIADLPPTRGFRQALQPQVGRGPRIIAEIKKASPSAGLIRVFQVDLRFLHTIHQAVKLPLLRKDFVFDPYQLYEARLHRADAVLLIAAALNVPQLIEFAALSLELDLEPLVEVHTEAELEKAIECACRVIGINYRDLHTFQTDVATTLDLLPKVPDGYLVVSESGLKDHATIARLEAHGVSAFLIGESLMRAPDIGAELDTLRGNHPPAENIGV